MAGQLKVLAGPAFLAAAVANIYTPAASTIYAVIYQIHIANVTAGAVAATIYRGATGGAAAGTEIMKGKSVPANDFIDKFFPKGLKMLSTDFLTGLDGAGSGASLTILVIGEQFVV